MHSVQFLPTATYTVVLLVTLPEKPRMLQREVCFPNDSSDL